jgi:NADH:ubiquinone oxidoreductase subunit 5 (subunit L)/multisubunit Na+/H+ antiporter MnhA subunit
MNLGAFGVLVWIRNRRTFGYTLDEITGLSRSMPLPALVLSAFMLSLTGIPPTIGFWGKFYLFTAVVDAGYTWLAVVAVVMSAVSAFYYLRVVWLMYFRERPDELTVSPTRPAARSASASPSESPSPASSWQASTRSRCCAPPKWRSASSSAADADGGAALAGSSTCHEGPSLRSEP